MGLLLPHEFVPSSVLKLAWEYNKKNVVGWVQYSIVTSKYIFRLRWFPTKSKTIILLGIEFSNLFLNLYNIGFSKMLIYTPPSTKILSENFPSIYALIIKDIKCIFLSMVGCLLYVVSFLGFTHETSFN